MYKLGKSLQSLLFSLAGDKFKDIVIIALSWNQTVGRIMAERSSIIKYDKQVLFVKVINHAWLQEFVIKKSEIKKRLIESTRIEIKEIVFMV